MTEKESLLLLIKLEIELPSGYKFGLLAILFGERDPQLNEFALAHVVSDVLIVRFLDPFPSHDFSSFDQNPWKLCVLKYTHN